MATRTEGVFHPQDLSLEIISPALNKVAYM